VEKGFEHFTAKKCSEIFFGSRSCEDRIDFHLKKALRDTGNPFHSDMADSLRRLPYIPGTDLFLGIATMSCYSHTS
jgi:hypothetical protein